MAPSFTSEITKCASDPSIHGGRCVMPGSVGMPVWRSAMRIVVEMLARIPPVRRHVDAAAECQGIVDDDYFLMMRRADGVRAVEFEAQPLACYPVEKGNGSHPAPERLQHAEVPLEKVDTHLRAIPRQPGQELSEAVRPFQRLGLRLELDSRIEIPADQHDAVLRLEHGGLGEAKIVGGIDNQGETVGAFDPPTCSARYQQTLDHLVQRFP